MEDHSLASPVGALRGVWLAVVLVLVGSSMWAATVQGGPAEDDFATRCAAAGVTACVGMEPSNLVLNNTIFTGASGSTPTLDTAVKTSGTGSLRLRWPAGTNTADGAGAGLWGMGANFGQNSTFYVQYRFRVNAAMLSNVGSGPWSLWKWVIFHGATTGSCSSIELTSETYPGSAGLARMYTDCGGRGLYTTNQDPNFIFNGSGNTIQQSAQSGLGYNCSHPSFSAGTGNGVGCLRFAANTWYTLYYKVHIGTWGSTNSTIQAWLAPEGATQWLQWIELRNVSLSFQNSPSDPGYNVVRFLTYQTGGSGVTPAQADAWYDELIVSTQPIALPRTSTGGDTMPPAPPTNVIITR